MMMVVLASTASALFAQNPQRGQQPAAAQRGQQPAAAQRGQQPAAAPPAPAPPAPRGPDGKVLLGSPLGQTGIWQGDGRLVINQKSYEPRTTLNAWIDIKDVPLQDWARALVDERHAAVLTYEPHARCKASGGPREFVTPYGFEILDMTDHKRVYVLDVGGPHSFRVIYLDRKEHPKVLAHSYYGVMV